MPLFRTTPPPPVSLPPGNDSQIQRFLYALQAHHFPCGKSFDHASQATAQYLANINVWALNICTLLQRKEINANGNQQVTPFTAST